VEFLQRSRHGTVYHFRRRVPKDLIAPLGRSQIVVTTRTEVRALAIRRARALLFATDDLFTDLRHLGKPNKAKTYTTEYGLAIEFDPGSGTRAKPLTALLASSVPSRQAQSTSLFEQFSRAEEGCRNILVGNPGGARRVPYPWMGLLDMALPYRRVPSK